MALGGRLGGGLRRHHRVLPILLDGGHLAQDPPEITRVPLQIAPDSWLNLNNYREVFQRESFVRYLFNTALVSFPPSPR